MLKFGDDQSSSLACAYVEQILELGKNPEKILKVIKTKGSNLCMPQLDSTVSDSFPLFHDWLQSYVTIIVICVCCYRL